MTHNLFGKLKYKDSDESWAGSAMLPRFATVGRLPDQPAMTEEEAAKLVEEMNAALESMRQAMGERFGQGALDALAAVDRAADEELQKADENPEPLDPKEQAREARLAEKRAKRDRLLAKGKFPIRVAGPSQAEPTPGQEAAFRFLLDNEQAVFDAVTGQVLESYQTYYDDERWRLLSRMKAVTSVADLTGHFAITRLDIAREARGGFAHLMFLIDSDWQDEHGLIVVYSPDTRSAGWTSWDCLSDLLESDEPDEAGEEYVPTPHDELLEAILTGNDAKARELVASGADINALGPDEYPPLWISVDQMEPEEVRRLLAFGADPKLANPDEKTTPLKHAKRMYRDMGFAPSKQRNELMDGILSMMREAVGKQIDDIKARLETIIKLLEEAERK
jgi:hypothetical protein